MPQGFDRDVIVNMPDVEVYWLAALLLFVGVILGSLAKPLGLRPLYYAAALAFVLGVAVLVTWIWRAAQELLRAA